MPDDDKIPGKTMKRRGILAVAGAAVAGMVAKQTSQSVVAAGGTVGTNFTANGISGADMGFDASATGFRYGVYGRGSFIGVYGIGDTTGVYGQSSGNSLSMAVYGKHFTDGYAVYGEATASGGYGVTGVAGDQFGVLGTSATGIGVQGQCDSVSGTAVKGVSAGGFPIIGVVTGSGSGSNAAAGMLGAGTIGPGVQGQSASAHGLVGTTNATDGHAGLLGNANKAGGIGLMGIAPNYGTPSVGLAGDFFGNVKINGGTLSAPVMQAVIKHAGDNTYRLLYSEGATESWCADYGKGTLAGGKADVKLDPDFAALVHTDDYHVFLTPHTPQHLHVPEQTATGFTVVATPSGMAQTGGPKRPEGVGTFSYRVVARRKDLTSERLAKVAAPTPPKVPTTFAIPETPAVTPLPKKP